MQGALFNMHQGTVLKGTARDREALRRLQSKRRQRTTAAHVRDEGKEQLEGKEGSQRGVGFSVGPRLPVGPSDQLMANPNDQLSVHTATNVSDSPSL